MNTNQSFVKQPGVSHHLLLSMNELCPTDQMYNLGQVCHLCNPISTTNCQIIWQNNYLNHIYWTQIPRLWNNHLRQCLCHKFKIPKRSQLMTTNLVQWLEKGRIQQSILRWTNNWRKLMPSRYCPRDTLSKKVRSNMLISRKPPFTDWASNIPVLFNFTIHFKMSQACFSFWTLRNMGSFCQ